MHTSFLAILFWLPSHPLHPFLLFTQHIHTFMHNSMLLCKYECVSVCTFPLCMCVGIDTRRLILGLNQASAPEDCRLMWPISSDYSCMVTASLEEQRRIAARKSLRMWFTHLFIFPKRQCGFEYSLHFVTMLSFYSFCQFLTSLSLSLCFLLFSSLFTWISSLSHLS